MRISDWSSDVCSSDLALYWLHEYRFDGLRLDAVHAIDDPDFLDELAQRVRAMVEPGRHVHLVLEDENNDARLQQTYDAHRNDNPHNAIHVVLTGSRKRIGWGKRVSRRKDLEGGGEIKKK